MNERPEMQSEVKMALGRMFQMMMRPAQPGDVEMYNAIRSIVMNHAEHRPEWVPNYARDRLLGAAGD